MNNNTSLVEVKPNIFTKMKNFFKKLFFKQEKKVEVTERIAIVGEESKSQDSKKDFFKLYKQVRQGNVDLYSLETEELKKIKALMDEELRMRKEKLNQIITEVKMCEFKLKSYNNTKE